MLPTANADDILFELDSVVEYIREYSPDSIILKQNVPLKPKKDTFVIRFQNASVVEETAISYVDTREWAIVYIGGDQSNDVSDVLTKMNGIKRKVYGDIRRVIPIKNNLRYMRAKGFTFGQTVRMENGNHAAVGILTTEVRKARDLETYEKIMRTGVRRG